MKVDLAFVGMVLLVCVVAFAREMYDFSVYKVACPEYDTENIYNKSCYTKSKSRHKKLHHILLSIKPGFVIDNIMVYIQYFVKYQTYKPLLLKAEEDFCRFIKGEKKAPLTSMLWPMLAVAGNINHTCPIQHDIVIHDLEFTDEHLPNILPGGESRVDVDVWANKRRFVKVQFFVMVSAKGNNNFKGK